MVNVKEENKNKQSNNSIKEGTNEFLDNQRQQLENTTSTISETTNRLNEKVNEYQRSNKEIVEKSINTANRYQQETINTIQSMSNNYVELQKNFLNSFQSVFSRFLNDTYNNKSYSNNFTSPQQYTDAYNKTNQTITNNTINCTRRLNDFAVTSTESFNKSIEIAQKYYNESIQNYINLVNKVGRSYSNQ
jgi:hypothetical protein